MTQNNISLADVTKFLKDIKNNSVDLIIADPPYNIGIDKWDKFNSSKQYWNFMFSWIDLSIEKLKNGGSFYLFNNQFNSAIILSYLRNKLVFNNWITWYKKDGFHPTKKRYVNNQETILFFSKGNPKTFNYEKIRIPYLSIKRLTSGNGCVGKNGKYWKPNPNGKLCTDVWDVSSERHTKKINGKILKPLHPTIKPQKIIERIIVASSNEGDMVLDLFSGSGQTSIIAKAFKRNSDACEINKKYFKQIKEKLWNN